MQLQFMKYIEKLVKIIKNANTSHRALHKFEQTRGNFPMHVDQEGNTTSIQASTLFSPSGYTDWEMPRTWQVFRHLSTHIYWTGNFAKYLEIIQDMQGASYYLKGSFIRLSADFSKKKKNFAG